MDAVLTSVQVGLPEDRDLPLPSGRPGPPLRTAIGRAPVDGPVRITRLGAEGDAVGDVDNHGGPDKALCAYVVDHLPDWRARLGRDLQAGAFGENLSISGTDEDQVAIGDVYAVGTTLVQVSQPRAPCATLARRWQVPDLVLQVRRSGRSGWYLRVLEAGELAAGQRLTLVDRPHPEWTIARCNAVVYGLQDEAVDTGGLDRDALAAAAEQGSALPPLSAEWRMVLRRAAARTG